MEKEHMCHTLTDYVRIEECLVMYLALTSWTCPTLVTFRSIRKTKNVSVQAECDRQV